MRNIGNGKIILFRPHSSIRYCRYIRQHPDTATILKQKHAKADIGCTEAENRQGTSPSACKENRQQIERCRHQYYYTDILRGIGSLLTCTENIFQCLKCFAQLIIVQKIDYRSNTDDCEKNGENDPQIWNRIGQYQNNRKNQYSQKQEGKPCDRHDHLDYKHDMRECNSGCRQP